MGRGLLLRASELREPHRGVGARRGSDQDGVPRRSTHPEKRENVVFFGILRHFTPFSRHFPCFWSLSASVLAKEGSGPSHDHRAQALCAGGRCAEEQGLRLLREHDGGGAAARTAL